MNTPLISVVMSVFNGEKFLKEAIESTLNQSFVDFEFIISNNGSTDDTKNIIKYYQQYDKRIVLFDHEDLGHLGSLNQAIGIAKTNIIARMDADDIMMDNRLEKQYEFLNNNLDVSVISCLAFYINKNGKKIGNTFSDIKSISDNKRYIAKNDPIGILHPGAMFYKDKFVSVGKYRDIFFPAGDIDLWNRFNDSEFWVVVQQEKLMKYRISNESEITINFMNSLKKFQWCRECMWLRRSGDKEITWEEFIEKQKKSPIIIKINKYRKDHAKFYYRNAGFNFASNNFLKFLIQLSLAAFLQPTYVLKKLYKQRVL